MIKPKEIVCPECNDGKVKPSMRGLCLYHYRIAKAREYQARAKAKPAKRYKPTGEMPVFNEIFREREKLCFVTGNRLRSEEFYKQRKMFHHLFHHVLPKSTHPEFRHYKKNIIMVEPAIHHKIETQALSDLIHQYVGYEKLLKLYQELKEEYVNL